MNDNDPGLIPEALIEWMRKGLVERNPYAGALTFTKRGRERTIGQRIHTALWTWRYRIAHAIYPFDEGE